MTGHDHTTTAPEVSLPEGLVRPALAGVDAYEPGRPVEDVRRELGVASVIKLASNEGPFPPMPRAVAAMRDAAPGVRVYPDPGAWALRDALAARTGLGPAQILPGAGIDGLIKIMSLALLDPGDEVVMGWPSFLSWRVGAQIQGAHARTADLRPDGSYDLDALAGLVTARTKMAVVVSPNNPTGGAVGPDELRSFLDALPGHVLPVVDEAYFEYLPPGGHDAAALVAEGRPLAGLRTFSKAYGLAGLRVGYLMGPAALVRALGVVRNVFDLGSPAQAAAIASLEDADAHLPERIRLNDAERAMTASGLRALGLEPLPSTANFLLVDLGSVARAEAMNAALLARGVIVRPARAFGAPSSLRITIGLPEENARLLAAAAGALGDLEVTLEEVIAGVRAGERRAIGRAISLVERLGPEGRELAATLHPDTGRAWRVGVTGPPGVGKSTLIGALVRHLRDRGKRVAVVSVDPTSPFTRGAVLGDRIRLTDHFLDPGVFIRSMASRGHLGGLAEATADAVLVLDAAGFDVVLVETVGSGQNEVEVQTLTETVVLALMPGSGDGVQAIKAGLMEIPDVLAVTKADRPGADQLVSELTNALTLVPGGPWEPPIVRVTALEGGGGVAELWSEVEAHRAFMEADGRLEERRREGMRRQLNALALDRLARRVEVAGDERFLPGLIDDVMERRIDPSSAVDLLLERARLA